MSNPGARVPIKALQKGDRVVARLGDSVLIGTVVYSARSFRGSEYVSVNPAGEIRGFALDATWSFWRVTS